ncbi:helix-turn-helix domain-containing protein [Staphylococcus saprophyticus]|uniref:helix-turn-helix domain-containing protein n=1 Tax=Staphylococcus saprophyticus TaxID=29385 RepID=UPI00119DC558|nr:helix-turn-helix transcriptional regulator [Staphylococcus saprophyticus]
MEDERVKKLLKYISREMKNVRNISERTQEDVGFDLGVSPSYIGKLENGKLEKLSMFMYLKLAEYYDVDIKEVIKKAEYRMEIEEKYFGG